jgi:CRISPR-associated protein Cas1
MQLVFDTKGLVVTRLRGLFCVEAPDGVRRTISPGKVSSIAITQSCALHSGAVELAAAHEIPIYFLSPIGKVTARMSAPNFQSIAALRRKQVHFLEGPDASSWVTGLYLLKTEGQIQNLERLQAKHPSAAQMKSLIKKAADFPQLTMAVAGPKIMAMEATIARQYWQALAQWLPPECDFEKRTRRPSQDPFNASLNYYYGMLYTIVETGLFAAGLDPHLGLLHADEYNKPVLAFDFIEPFRPWVDWLLIEQFTAGKVSAGFFSKVPGGLALNKAGKAFFIPLFNDWLRSERSWGGKKTSVKNHIYQLAGRFAKKLRDSV